MVVSFYTQTEDISLKKEKQNLKKYWSRVWASSSPELRIKFRKCFISTYGSAKLLS